MLLALFVLAVFFGGCSQVASGDDFSNGDSEYIFTTAYVDGGWTFENWNFTPYYFPEMFDSVTYEVKEMTAAYFREGEYLELNTIYPTTDSAYFVFRSTISKRYILSMDKEGDTPPVLKLYVLSYDDYKYIKCDIEAVEKDGRWYYPIDMNIIYPKAGLIDVGLYNSDGSMFSGKVENLSIFDNGVVYPLEFSANLIVTGKYMGTEDQASVDDIADRIFARLNQALNPGGVYVRHVNILYAKEHPVVGDFFSEKEPYVMVWDNGEKRELLDKLIRWPGHEGEIPFILGYYIDDENGTTLGESPYSGEIYYDESQSWADYIYLGTHWKWGEREQASQKIADVALHELGHVFGLYHTSEFGGKNFDNLEDTPECPSIKDVFANNDGCPDARYIMFPQEGGVRYTTFTPQQMDVIRLYLSMTPHK